MAAKQGISAHLHQASSDARQAVLTRTPAFIHSHSWLSNLNTTCTIKSAPPRTPEVMTLLSSKSGWLIKKNESHVWQKRWCCVVPHTFLYYFDQCPASNQTENLQLPFNSPVGIIDLECYTQVEQNPDFVMEISGDSITNPDLRSFYFQCASEEERQAWTTALLSDRHGALKDEREAYRQVCDTFPLQLRELSNEIERFERKAKEYEEESYRVRSVAEDCRKKVVSVVRDTLDRSRPYNEDLRDVEIKRKEVLILLDKVTTEAVNMNAGVVDSVKLLAEYTNMLADALVDVSGELARDKEMLRHGSKVDREELEELQVTMDVERDAHQKELKKMNERICLLEGSLKSQRQECVDLNKNLEARKMEFAMLSTSSKQRISELSSHKKILKREVIDLRKKVDEIVSDVTAYQHKSQGLDVQVAAERERNEFLERHLTQLSQQMKVQEKMIDMMSQSGMSVNGNSVLGKEVVTPAQDASKSGRSMPPLPPKFTPSYITTTTPCNIEKDKLHKSNSDENPAITKVNSTGSTTTAANNTTTSDNRIRIAMFDSTSPESSPILNHLDNDEGTVDDNVSALTEDRTYSSYRGGGSTMANNTNPNQPPKQYSAASPRPPRSCKSDSISLTENVSVAQKARIDADSPKQNYIRVKKPNNARANSPSVWERWGRTFTDTSSCAEEKKSSVSLQERQRIQKEKQLEFLKKQGLLKAKV